MVYKALPSAHFFWMSYIKWYKFYNNNSSVILGSKKRGMLKLVNPKHEHWASTQLLTLSLLTLFTLPRFKVMFHWKQTREKLGNAWSAWRNFRPDLAWQMGKRKVSKEITRKSKYWKVFPAGDYFMTWKKKIVQSIYIEMCFNYNYKHSALHYH